MKKIIFIFVCLFLLSGCSAVYNLKIDDNIIEETIMTDNYNYSSSNYDFYNVYSTKPIPLSKYVTILSESDETFKGIEYYDLKDISDNSNFGLKYTGSFDKKIPISDSTILSFGIGNFDYQEDDGKISFTVPNKIKSFLQFPDLDSITVNIETKYKVLDNNADSISGNKYTWVIDRTNYKDKTISFSYDIENGINKNYFKDNPLIIFNICLVIIVFVCFIIYFIINRRYNKKNSL